jgi:hypothetical protein
MRENPREIVARLNPTVRLDGKSHRVIMQELASLPHNRLGAVVANADDRHTEFVAAIDLLFTGI